MRRASVYILVLLITGGALAGGKAGTESPFAFGAGSRSLALGGADLAVCHPSVAPFWNPSRLAAAERYSLAGFYSRLYDSDVAYQYLGMVVPTLDWGYFGAGVFRLGVDGIEKRDASNLLLGEFEDNRLAFYLAYSGSLSDFDFGCAILMEHHSIDNYSATSSPGLNISFSRHFEFNHRLLKNLSIAATMNHLVKPGMKMVDESVSNPMALNLAATAGIRPFNQDSHLFNLSIAANKVDKVETRISLGAEYDFEEMLFLRGGYRDGDPSLGAGLQMKGIAFDYAWLDRELGSLHLFTLTTEFGSSLADKRQQRIEQREMEFNSLMNDRLQSHNNSMVDEMVGDGKREMVAGDLVEAERYFDRALFMARNTGLDTTAIHTLVSDVRAQLKIRKSEQLSRAYLDSAMTRFDEEDYLGARYFANLSLAEKPDDRAALELKKRAREALDQMTSEEEMINRQIIVSDSLLSFGQINQALSVLEILTEYAPDNKRVKNAYNQALFEKYRNRAQLLYADDRYHQAVAALDSALNCFPNHQGCLELKGRIKSLIARAEKTQTDESSSRPPEEQRRTELSPELKKQIKSDYTAGQDLFKSGDLEAAIDYWERVEAISPGYQSVHDYLIKAYKFVGVELYGQNKYEEAVAVWKKAERLDPGNQEISGYIKRTQSEIKRLEELSYEAR